MKVAAYYWEVARFAQGIDLHLVLWIRLGSLHERSYLVPVQLLLHMCAAEPGFQEIAALRNGKLGWWR